MDVCILGKKKYMCLLSHAEKIRVGQSEIFFKFIFYNWIDVGCDLECISTLEEWHLTRFVKIIIP